MKIRLVEIAEIVQGTIIGAGDIEICGLAAIDDVQPNCLIFADSANNLKRAEDSCAAAILVNKSTNTCTKPLIQVDEPLQAFIRLLNYFYPPIKIEATIHPTASIATDVKLGKNIHIGAFVTIGSASQIGDNCIIHSHAVIGNKVIVGASTVIHPHVVLYDHTELGHEVIIHANSVIGADGFGYKFIDGSHVKVPHVGKVIIENNVEVGALTAIDRATIGATRIGAGSKIDNLVQIAHSVKLGKDNIVCAFTGIAGSSASGERVIFAANVGVSDHVRIDNDVILTARAGVPSRKHLKTGNIYFGNPARPKEKALEQELALTRLPFLRKKLAALSEKVDLLLKKSTTNVSAE